MIIIYDDDTSWWYMMMIMHDNDDACWILWYLLSHLDDDYIFQEVFEECPPEDTIKGTSTPKNQNQPPEKESKFKSMSFKRSEPRGQYKTQPLLIILTVID